MKKPRSTKLIAIVDDDESVQDALQDLIEAEGLSAKCFGSAEEFLESGLQRTAACLITDIRMPGMSGLELQAKLKADGCNIPIIFITAHGDARAADTGNEGGCSRVPDETLRRSSFAQ